MWLREVRRQLGITQEQLEITTGYSQAVISRIELGSEGYSADFVIAVALALEADPVEALVLAGKLPALADEDAAPVQAKLLERAQALLDQLGPEGARIALVVLEALKIDQARQRKRG